MKSTPRHLYVNMPGQTPCFGTVTAALNSLQTDTGQEKKYPAPVSGLPPVILHIGSGTYREKLVITRPNLTLRGEGNTPSDVTLVWGDADFDEMPTRASFSRQLTDDEAARYTMENVLDGWKPGT